jgi:tRNA A-37 threonylcarbamoyl transferase component Bud32
VDGPSGFDEVTFCGAGATSRVFRAVQTSTGRVVALKRLHRQLVKDKNALARLKRELEALRLLRHEVLVQVWDVISWGGDPTLVMDFIEGEDLKETITRRTMLTPLETEHIARALFGALALTHASGIVHRDVKPQNVRMTRDGRVYLLDFGSARLDAASQLTTTGTTVGTPEYMPPELFAGPVYDPRVDVYGVGATLYECLTGSPPQAADSLAELAHLRTSVDVKPIRELVPGTPRALARVIDRCLARAPEDRFPSAALASWSLDNPAAERALAARRSAHPLCLHCGTPIPKESATCSSCRSKRPFRYVLGPCHVVLRSVENVGRFLEHVATRFPDLSAPDELHVLAERCAALSFGAQRYVSFVSEQEAEAIVRELAEVGARAAVEREPAWWRSLLFGLLFPLYFPIRVPMALLGGAGSMLSASPIARPVMPRVASASWAIAALSISALITTLAIDERWFSVFGRDYISISNDVLGGTAVLFVVSLLVFATNLFLGHPTPKIPECTSPQPKGAISEAMVATTPAEKKKASDAAPIWMLGVTLLLLLGECIGLGFVAGAATPTDVVTTQQRGPTGAVLPVDLPTTEVRAVDRETRSMRGEPHVQPTPILSTALLAQLAPLGIGAVLVAAMLRRRRRIRRDAAAIMAELDLTTFAQLARRSRPDRTAPGAPHALSHMKAGDAFVAEAIKRASDIMPLLGREQAARLAACIEALLTAGAPADVKERSLLARCILEADPRHRLRLDLLAIEGQLEAAAAQEWLVRIGEHREEETDDVIEEDEAPAAKRARVRR